MGLDIFVCSTERIYSFSLVHGVKFNQILFDVVWSEVDQTKRIERIYQKRSARRTWFASCVAHYGKRPTKWIGGVLFHGARGRLQNIYGGVVYHSTLHVPVISRHHPAQFEGGY